MPGISSIPLVKARHAPVEYWVMHVPNTWPAWKSKFWTPAPAVTTGYSIWLV